MASTEAKHLSEGEEPSPKRHHPGGQEHFPFLDGCSMPAFGLGVYRSEPGKESENAVYWALEAGYRLIDTAALYDNEQDVAKAIARATQAGILKNGRKDVFITTKLWDSDHGYEKCLKAARQSLENLKTDYIDLYLIHSPNKGQLADTWRAMLELKRRGQARSVGVSNFNVRHLEALKGLVASSIMFAEYRESLERPPAGAASGHANATLAQVLPVVNQFEFHPLLYKDRKRLLDYCQREGMVVTAYGSLFSGQTAWLRNKDLVTVMEEVRKGQLQGGNAAGLETCHIALQWALQLGIAVIPKSVKQSRIVSNCLLSKACTQGEHLSFRLTPKQMDTLGNLRGDLGEYWDPLKAPIKL